MTAIIHMIHHSGDVTNKNKSQNYFYFHNVDAHTIIIHIQMFVVIYHRVNVNTVLNYYSLD